MPLYRRHTRHAHFRCPQLQAVPATLPQTSGSFADLKDGAGARKVLIIGGGIGGLVTAGRLAREGFRVEILEQNAEVREGGR